MATVAGTEEDPVSAPAPAGPQVVDLDKARAIRREGRGDNLEVINKGERFLLPVELPVEAVGPLTALADLEDASDDGPGQDQLQTIRDALEGGLVVLFCDETEPPRDDAGLVPARVMAHATGCSWRRFLGTRPSLDDQLELWGGLFGAYGTSLGEALASLDSSPSGGRPAKATAGGSTASSSPPPATAAERKAQSKAQTTRARKRAAARGGGTRESRP